MQYLFNIALNITVMFTDLMKQAWAWINTIFTGSWQIFQLTVSVALLYVVWFQWWVQETVQRGASVSTKAQSYYSFQDDRYNCQ
jgi:hypothetical protein